MAKVQRDNLRIYDLINSLIGWFSGDFNLPNYLGLEAGLSLNDEEGLENFCCSIDETLEEVICSFSDETIETILYTTINEYIASTEYYCQNDEELEEEYADFITAYKDPSYEAFYF